MTDSVRPYSNSEVKYTETAGSAPAQDCENITPSDVTEYEPYIRSLRIGVTGDVTVVTSRGTTVLFQGVQAGETLPIWVKQVLATGTTATNIVGYYG